MHAHRYRRAERVRRILLALLFPALLALGASPTRAQSYLVSTPSLTGGWAANFSPAAVGGVYYVTYNTQNTPTSAAEWDVILPQSGQYQVYASSVPTMTVPRTANARYQISTSLGTQLVSGVNQDFSGEQLLGTFSMNAGPNAVRLTDLTGEPDLSRTVVANAARWVLVSGGPPPPPGTPVITGYLDYYGHAVGGVPPGDPVQIIGNNFGLTPGKVSFAGFDATAGIVRWTPTDIRVIAPLTGSYPTVGPVTVTTSGGQTATGPTFTIDPGQGSPTPAPPGPGPIQPPPVPVVTGYAATNPRGVPISSAPPTAPMLIEGSNLGTSGSVAFNGIPAPVVSWSPTELLVTVPSAPYYPFQGPVTVTTNGQTASGPVFTILAPATLPPSADWPMFMHDPRQTGLADTALDPNTLAPWSLTIGGPPGSSPVVIGGIAYLGTAAGLVSIDTSAHMIRWVHALAPVRSAPAATAQIVVVSAGGLYGLSPADGSVVWQRPDIIANDDVSPILVNGTIYIGTRSGIGAAPAMYAVDAATGANVWPAPISLPAGFEVRGTAAASTDIGLLYVGIGPPAGVGPVGGASAVWALRLTDGGAAWSMPVSAVPAGISIGYAGSGAQPGPGGVLPALVQAAVFVATGPNVVALSAYNGSTIWTRSLPEPALQGPPALSSAGSGPSTLYVGGTNGGVYALNSLTGGDAAGGLATRLSPITGPLALAGHTLYVPTYAGLTAVDVTSSTVIWTSPLAAGSGVAVAGGAPYLASSDGRFFGFAAGGFLNPTAG
jgi:hypothetical protein